MKHIRQLFWKFLLIINFLFVNTNDSLTHFLLHFHILTTIMLEFSFIKRTQCVQKQLLKRQRCSAKTSCFFRYEKYYWSIFRWRNVLINLFKIFENQLKRQVHFFFHNTNQIEKCKFCTMKIWFLLYVLYIVY